MNYKDGENFKDAYYAFAAENGYEIKEETGIHPHFDFKSTIGGSVSLSHFTCDADNEFGESTLFPSISE